jgi:hypothetical protein
LFGQNQDLPPALASLRSPKTGTHLVGFASFSQNENLRSLASFRDLPWLCSAKNPTRGHLVWSSLD